MLQKPAIPVQRRQQHGTVIHCAGLILGDYYVEHPPQRRGDFLCAAARLCHLGHCRRSHGTPADYGSSAPHAAAQRSIELQADTRHINVTRGETVTIARAGQRLPGTCKL